MKKSTVILISFILTIIFSSCENKCISCRVYYLKRVFYNNSLNDSIRIDLASNNYMIDTLEKYQKLGYKPTDIGVSYSESVDLCRDEIKSLDDKGINYKCYY